MQQVNPDRITPFIIQSAARRREAQSAARAIYTASRLFPGRDFQAAWRAERYLRDGALFRARFFFQRAQQNLRVAIARERRRQMVLARRDWPRNRPGKPTRWSN